MRDRGTVLCPVPKARGTGRCPDFPYIAQMSTPTNGKVVD